MKYLYLLLNIAAVLIPFALSFDKKVYFVQYWKFLFPSILFAMAFFIPWDIAFTKAGIWGFNESYLSGVYLLNLPLEEWLFFITIPYACVFTFEVLIAYLGFTPFPNISKSYSISVGVVLLSVGLFHMAPYTTITFVALALLLFLHQIWWKTKWLGYFHLSYVLILVPFMIVNGILTGSFIQGEVVWYNDAYNLGDRFFTIPIEDIFYGMLLMLTVLTPYEYLKSRWLRKHNAPPQYQ